MLLREYETIYILKPDITDENINQVNQRLMNVFEQDGAHVLRHNTWGKKKLAFEVKKQPKGIYVHLQYLSKPSTIQELERNLRLIEPVLAYQTIKIATDVDVERRLAEKEQENKRSAASRSQDCSDTTAHKENEVGSDHQIDDDNDSSDLPEKCDEDEQTSSSDQDS